jgi:hypothetical protein
MRLAGWPECNQPASKSNSKGAWKLLGAHGTVNLANGDTQMIKGARNMIESRIPQLTGTSKKAAFAWLTALHKAGLLFCPDDRPQDIVTIADGLQTFSTEEAESLTKILSRLFEKRGKELHDLAYEVVSRTFHTPAERRSFKTMYG